jgi:hypothetical protein
MIRSNELLFKFNKPFLNLDEAAGYLQLSRDHMDKVTYSGKDSVLKTNWFTISPNPKRI